MNKIEFNESQLWGYVIFKASEIKWENIRSMKVALSFQLFRADC